MRLRLSTHFFIAILFIVFVSCEALPGYHSSYDETWYTGSAFHLKRKKGNIFLLDVSVNRAGGRDSIQGEINNLAPLLFWKHGLYVVSDIADADYAADIRVHEREYMSKWQTKRSLSLAVRIWSVPGSAADSALFENMLPLTAGRVVSLKNRTFSSSRTVDRMLMLAIRNAVMRLGKKR